MIQQQSGTTPYATQMQGEIPGTFSFNAAAVPVCTLERTPHTALSVEPDMIKGLKTLIRPVYGEAKNHTITLCGYGAALEPPSYQPAVRAISAIHDYAGLQIILCAVNGERVRKDGVPYHMIFSSDSNVVNHNVLDENYQWPVTEITDMQIERNNKGRPCIAFANATTTMKPYQRVLGSVEKRAEELATAAYRQETFNQSIQYRPLDIVSLDMEVALAKPYRTPPVVRIEYRNGRRMASPIIW